MNTLSAKNIAGVFAGYVWIALYSYLFFLALHYMVMQCFSNIWSAFLAMVLGLNVGSGGLLLAFKYLLIGDRLHPVRSAYKHLLWVLGAFIFIYTSSLCAEIDFQSIQQGVVLADVLPVRIMQACGAAFIATLAFVLVFYVGSLVVAQLPGAWRHE